MGLGGIVSSVFGGGGSSSSTSETVEDYSQNDQIRTGTILGDGGFAIGKVGDRNDIYITDHGSVNKAVQLSSEVASGAYAVAENLSNTTAQTFKDSMNFVDSGLKSVLDFASLDRQKSFESTSKAFSSINHNLDTALDFVEEQNAPDSGLTKDLVTIMAVAGVAIALVFRMKGK